MKDEAIEFVKVDVDALADLAKRLKISAMPTFQLYKDGALVEEIVGADFPKISKLVTKSV
jgi:thioredoxin 1